MSHVKLLADHQVFDSPVRCIHSIRCGRYVISLLRLGFRAASSAGRFGLAGLVKRLPVARGTESRRADACCT